MANCHIRNKFTLISFTFHFINFGQYFAGMRDTAFIWILVHIKFNIYLCNLKLNLTLYGRTGKTVLIYFMKELQLIKNESNGFELNRVLTYGSETDPWFVGKYAAEQLGYSNTRDVLSNYVDEDDRATVAIYDGRSGQNRNMVIINESGLYSLILQSKMPKAKEFKKWVTKEVLPSIRKTGKYEMKNENDTILEIRDMMREFKKELQSKTTQLENTKQELEKAQPAIDFHRAVSKSPLDVSISDFAKEISEYNNMVIGKNRLYRILRKLGYLSDSKSNFNSPYQKWIDKGFFKVVEMKYLDAYDNEQTSIKLYVTGKGRTEIYQKVCAYLHPIKSVELF